MTQADKEFILNQAAIIADKAAIDAADRVLGAHHMLARAIERDPYSAETIAKRDALHAAIAQAARLRDDANTLMWAARDDSKPRDND
jgi:hypothetical protein